MDCRSWNSIIIAEQLLDTKLVKTNKILDNSRQTNNSEKSNLTFEGDSEKGSDSFYERMVYDEPTNQIINREGNSEKTLPRRFLNNENRPYLEKP